MPAPFFENSPEFLKKLDDLTRIVERIENPVESEKWFFLLSLLTDFRALDRDTQFLELENLLATHPSEADVRSILRGEPSLFLDELKAAFFRKSA